MDIPIQLPNSIYGWFAIGAFIISAILFIRRSDIKAIKENADELRKILLDKEKEMIGMHNEIELLKGKVDFLEKTNKTLEDLVVVALKQYFLENPNLAKQFKDIVKGGDNGK